VLQTLFRGRRIRNATPKAAPLHDGKPDDKKKDPTKADRVKEKESSGE